jgi:hypothetical protein
VFQAFYERAGFLGENRALNVSTFDAIIHTIRVRRSSWRKVVPCRT